MPPLDNADAPLASDAPFLAVEEPALLLLSLAVGILARAIGNAHALDRPSLSPPPRSYRNRMRHPPPLIVERGPIWPDGLRWIFWPLRNQRFLLLSPAVATVVSTRIRAPGTVPLSRAIFTIPIVDLPLEYWGRLKKWTYCRCRSSVRRWAVQAPNTTTNPLINRWSSCCAPRAAT
jgi:hypothetical protein